MRRGFVIIQAEPAVLNPRPGSPSASRTQGPLGRTSNSRYCSVRGWNQPRPRCAFPLPGGVLTERRVYALIGGLYLLRSFCSMKAESRACERASDSRGIPGGALQRTAPRAARVPGRTLSPFPPSPHSGYPHAELLSGQPPRPFSREDASRGFLGRQGPSAPMRASRIVLSIPPPRGPPPRLSLAPVPLCCCCQATKETPPPPARFAGALLPLHGSEEDPPPQGNCVAE